MISQYLTKPLGLDKKKIKIFVGISGGVDSAVSAALLKKAGYDVTGVFIKVWQPDWIECSWKEDRREAMRVSAHLGIPFITLDLEKEYKEGVIDYMIAEYSAGRTPNPDVMCNREVKFGAFWNWAKNNGANYVATGHYCQNKNFELHMAKDKNKDQSYFLWTLKKTDLEHVLFPVGGITKPKVRKLAEKFKLPNAYRKDSQGLCFIGKVDVKKFLTHYIETKPGDVLNEKGEKIGTHPGALLFTIGERHGFQITKKTPFDCPYYVIAKDIKQNTLIVSDHNADIDKRNQTQNIPVHLSKCSWVNFPPQKGERLQARGRYRQELVPIYIEKINETEAMVIFETKQETITPGQSLVIYDGEKCVGGGIITSHYIEP